MHVITNYNKKICFWWSAKCGCSTVKYLFRKLSGKSIPLNLHIGTYGSLNNTNIGPEFKHILFIRNPYERLVSGFLDFYVHESMKLKGLPPDNLTFAFFVDELKDNGLLNIDYHHFTPQLSEKYDERFENFENFEFFRIYDINSINKHVLNKNKNIEWFHDSNDIVIKFI